MEGWISPSLQIRFAVNQKILELYKPNGEKFGTFVETIQQKEREREAKELERQRAERTEAELEQTEAVLE